MRDGHPRNSYECPSIGWFGDPRNGVYVSRYLEYCLHNSNVLMGPQGPYTCTPTQNDVIRVVVVKVVPGRSKRVETAGQHMRASTDGFDSHVLSANVEWFLFDETQACPIFVLDVRVEEFKPGNTWTKVT
eukprot:TRINITY_DN3985_c0_g2_i1.p1 TRINITY_DN3985_c0_g2~~TRINITY_DN3985_c0_g2_i1.p1  ORF type:complete len:130 (-),score=12.52 TRINITY_DN3985_c0_g2_i1:25-414(-)